MPIQRCKVKGKLGWKWGQSGKCYLGPGAIAKARRQEAAIRASGWTENARLTRDTKPGVTGTTEEVRIPDRGTQQPSTTDSDVDPVTVHNARSPNGSVTSSAPRTKVVPSNPLKADPTRTITLRRRFERALTRRFLELKTKLIDLVAREDAFALSPKNKLPDLATPLPARFTENEDGSERGQVASVHSNSNVGNSSVEPIPMDGRLTVNTRFRFHTDAEKVQLFQQWLAVQAQNGILQTTQSNAQDAYWAAYIEDAFKKGAGRAFDDTKAAARATAWTPEEGAFYQGTKAQFLQSAFAHPIAIDKVKLLASRTFTDLQGVTDAMGVKMSRVLTDGLAQGQSPRVVARTLAKEVDVGITRARTIARTETIRAHAQGQLVALEQLGVKEIGVMVEWSSVDDDRRCPLCEALEGVVLKIKEANTLIPRHPNCRCAFIPANVGESTKGQKRGKTKIQQAIDESVRREIPKRSKRSLAEQKSVSRWPGAEKNITKTRPVSALKRRLPREKPVAPKESEEDRDKHYMTSSELQKHLLGSKSAPSFSLKEESSRMEELLKQRSRRLAGVKEHGMSIAEDMRSVVIDDVGFSWADNPEQLSQASKSITELVFNKSKIPSKLWDSNNRVIFTSQLNKDDVYWAKTYGTKSFRSRATGGDGSVVVYNKRIGVSTFSHESGHNFAFRTWGDTHPFSSSPYGIAQKLEGAVTEYGANSPAEDFAEACKMYVTEKHRLLQGFPKKFDALNDLLGGTKVTKAEAAKILAKEAEAAASNEIQMLAGQYQAYDKTEEVLTRLGMGRDELNGFSARYVLDSMGDTLSSNDKQILESFLNDADSFAKKRYAAQQARKATQRK